MELYVCGSMKRGLKVRYGTLYILDVKRLSMKRGLKASVCLLMFGMFMLGLDEKRIERVVRGTAWVW